MNGVKVSAFRGAWGWASGSSRAGKGLLGAGAGALSAPRLPRALRELKLEPWWAKITG